MGIGTSSTRTTSKSTGMLAVGRKEKSIIKRQIACWRCCSSNILVQRRDAGAREHLCSQQDSSSVGGGWQEGSDSWHQYRLNWASRHSPAQRSSPLYKWQQMECLCPRSAQGERKTLWHDSHGENRNNKYSPDQTAKALQSMVNLKSEL